jgi:hypothetical protein
VLAATIFAIFVGPIRAVQITRRNDSERVKHNRQYDIFYNLMRTRRIQLAPERVTALNLVQLEFYGKEKIISAYKSYISHLSLPVPNEEGGRFLEDREDLFFDLIHEIGCELGYTLDKRELNKFSYSPQGWNIEQNEIQMFRRLMIQLLNGDRPLPITQFAKAFDKFPPPPTST